MITLHPKYFSIIQAPLEQLRRALATGSLQTKEEARRVGRQWSRDLEMIEVLRKKHREEVLFRALDTAKENPEGVVEVMEPYCTALLKLGKKLVYVEELQICYWIDALTIAFVRLKRWQDAKQWLDLHLALLERYHGRSSRSMEATLHKRLKRCTSMLQE